MSPQLKGAPELRPWPSDFVCDDCGKRRRNQFRHICTVCKLLVCGLCKDKHELKQHQGAICVREARRLTVNKGHDLPEGMYDGTV